MEYWTVRYFNGARFLTACFNNRLSAYRFIDLQSWPASLED